MRIDRFLSQNRIVDLKSTDFQSALGELLDVALPAEMPRQMRDTLNKSLLARESVMPTRIGDLIALPHSRAQITPTFIFAIGRFPKAQSTVPVATPPSTPPSVPVTVSTSVPATAPNTVPAPVAPQTSAPVAAVTEPATATTPPSVPVAQTATGIIFLVLASEKSRLYHSVLSEIVHDLDDDDFLARLRNSQSLKDFRKEITQLFRGVSKQARDHESGTNRLIGKTASHLARGTKCNVLLFFADTFTLPPMLDKYVYSGFKVIIVSSENYDFHSDEGEKPEVIVVRSFSNHRMSQLRAALFVGLMRGVISPTDRICCLGGTNKSDHLDSILIINVAREFPTVMTARANTLVPAHVRPEVIERAIAIATELAVEGREGKPVGTMLVIGEREKIRTFVEPLIMNPFNGYSEEDRNILNPFMSETVKELALIDGAFTINGNGVIDSAGSFITAARTGMNLSLPGGLGTRHAAACAISIAADCAAIVVSSSGQITLFRHGEGIMLLERSVSRTV